MPDNNTIDNLKIVVEGESRGVESKLIGIANALKNVRSAVTSNTSKNVGKFSESLRTLSKRLAEIPNSDVSKLQRIASAMSTLKSIGVVKTGVSVTGRKAMADTVTTLEGGTTEAESTARAKAEEAKKIKDAAAKVKKEEAERLKALKARNEKVAELKKMLGSTKLSAIPKALTRIAFYRAVRAIIQKIYQSITEGARNAYNYSKATNGEYYKSKQEITASMQYLTNALGAAAAEITTAIAPTVVQIADKLADCANNIAQMTAYLRGSSTYLKSVKKEAKETAGILLGFDEINKMGDNNFLDSFVETAINVDEAKSTLHYVQLIGVALGAWTIGSFILDLGKALKLVKEISTYSTLLKGSGIATSAAGAGLSGAGTAVGGASLAGVATIGGVVTLAAAAIGISVYSIKKMYEQAESLNAARDYQGKTASMTEALVSATTSAYAAKDPRERAERVKLLNDLIESGVFGNAGIYSNYQKQGGEVRELESSTENVINIQIGDSALDSYYTKRYNNNIRNVKLPVN